jgi:hypothetical protein
MNPTTLVSASQARKFVETGVDARLAPAAAVSTQTTALIITAPLTTSISTQTDSLATSTTTVITQTESPVLTSDATGTSQTEQAFIENGTKSDTDNTNSEPFYKLTTTYDDYSTQMNPTMCVAMSQSPALFRNGKNAETVNKSENYCRISPYITDFSSLTPSVTSSASTTPSTTITARKPRPKTADFAQKVEKVENPSHCIQTTPETINPSIVRPENDETTAHATQPIPDNVLSQPTATSTTASSSLPSQSLPSSRHKKKRIITRHFRFSVVYGVPSTYLYCYSSQNALSAGQFCGKLPKTRKTTHFHPKRPGTTHFNTFQMGRRCKRTSYTIYGSYKTTSRPFQHPFFKFLKKFIFISSTLSLEIHQK